MAQILAILVVTGLFAYFTVLALGTFMVWPMGFVTVICGYWLMKALATGSI